MTEPAQTGVRTGERTSRRFSRLAAASIVTIVMASAAVSCGDDSGEADTRADSRADSAAVAGTSSPPVGADAANGEQLARSRGCAGCHGPDFSGGAGPGWVGLAGSEQALADGTVVVADEAYLSRAIADPSAEIVADYTLRMPANGLSDAEIADIVAFIGTLADE